MNGGAKQYPVSSEADRLTAIRAAIPFALLSLTDVPAFWLASRTRRDNRQSTPESDGWPWAPITATMARTAAKMGAGHAAADVLDTTTPQTVSQFSSGGSRSRCTLAFHPGSRP